MSNISSLSTVTQLALGDLVVLYSQNQGGDRCAPLSMLAAFFQSQVTSAAGQTQYAAPSATGFSVLIAPAVSGGSVDLILTPSATYATGTITLPASPIDRQRVNVVTTQTVTALTVAGNGATVTGAPTTLAANAFFTVRYDAVLGVWFRTN